MTLVTRRKWQGSFLRINIDYILLKEYNASKGVDISVKEIIPRFRKHHPKTAIWFWKEIQRLRIRILLYRTYGYGKRMGSKSRQEWLC